MAYRVLLHSMRFLFLSPIVAASYISTLSPAQSVQSEARHFPRGARAVGIPTASYDATTNSYLLGLRNLNGGKQVEYRVDVTASGTIHVTETTTGITPVVGAGVYARLSAPGDADYGSLVLPRAYAANSIVTTLVGHALSPDGTVSIGYEDTFVQPPLSNVVRHKTYSFRLVGKALQVEVATDATDSTPSAPNYAGFSFGGGDFGSTPSATGIVHIPYMDHVPVFVAVTAGTPTFCTRSIDWFVSPASEIVAVTPAVIGTQFVGEVGTAIYKNAQGNLNETVCETGYVVVSDDITDCFMVVDRAPSEYRRLMAGRTVTLCSAIGQFANTETWVQDCAAAGLDEVYHCKWGWAKNPFNVNQPDLVPQAPAIACGTFWGSGANFLSYATACRDANWCFAPYFETGSMGRGLPIGSALIIGNSYFPVDVNPLYNAAQCAHDAVGLPKSGFVQSLFVLDPVLGRTWYDDENVVVDHASREGNLVPVLRRIAGQYGFPTGGAFLDAMSDLPGWHEVDQSGDPNKSRSISQNLAYRDRIFRTTKDALEGPVLGEGSYHQRAGFATFIAGLADGANRTLPTQWIYQGATNNSAGPVLPDYELREVIPLATGNSGMGFEDHFIQLFDPAPPHAPLVHIPLDQPTFLDEWTTTVLSYGHNSHITFPGDNPTVSRTWRDQVRSYFQIGCVAKAMQTSHVTSVRYERNGTEIGLTALLAEHVASPTAGILRDPRLILEFANGLVFKANHGATDWVTTVDGLAVSIPQNGFCAKQGSELLAFSAVPPGSAVRLDYAMVAGQFEMLDRRGSLQDYNGVWTFAGLHVPTGLPGSVLPATVAVVDLRNSQVVFATNGRLLETVYAAVPAPFALELENEGLTITPGRPRIGITAKLRLGSSTGPTKDVTGLVSWSSNDTNVAKVTRMGGVIPVGPGQAKITASFPGVASVDATVDVTNDPDVSRLIVVPGPSGKALCYCLSDGPVTTATFLVRPAGTSTWLTQPARLDPSRKHCQTNLRLLQAGVSYEVQCDVSNGLGSSATNIVTFTAQ